MKFNFKLFVIGFFIGVVLYHTILVVSDWVNSLLTDEIDRKAKLIRYDY